MLADEIFDSSDQLPEFKLKRYNNAAYSKYLADLECFVEDLLNDDTIPFVRSNVIANRITYDSTPLARQYFALIPLFISTVNLLSPDYEYDEYIMLFIHCSRAMSLSEEACDWSPHCNMPSANYRHRNGMTGGEIFNALVNSIRTEARRFRIKQKIYRRRKESIERFTEYCDYCNKLFEKYGRLSVLRLDLFYKKEFSNSVNIQDVGKDLNRLFSNRRSNKLFANMCGYITKLEYGVEKGIHVHVIYFFDGSKRKNESHIYHAKQIGEYWKETITKGRGEYWNCNKQASEFEKNGIRGIGPINHDQTLLRENLLNRVIGYLTKLDQFIKPKYGTSIRLYRRGAHPSVPKIKRGRPRKTHDRDVNRSNFPNEIPENVVNK
ncbi:Protein of unknown function (DUF3296) [Thiocystis violascens DSM 198]|uniref:Inovirus Gp2 family protein n=2 Tax=Thiocystis violascens TaxID=73141 RepID=I3Y6N3_THIV6|nr:Protein of unknown function (DUF3296) [Thiocystis violascens DSM 198]